MIDFNLNKGMENPKTAKFIKRTFLAVLLLIGGISIFLVFNGKHNKLPAGIETNIPTPAPVDSSKNINMRDNNGTMNVNIK